MLWLCIVSWQSLKSRGLIQVSRRSGLFEKLISRVSRRSRLSEGLSSTTFETIRGIVKSSSVKFRAEETELIALIFTPILNFALTGNWGRAYNSTATKGKSFWWWWWWWRWWCWEKTAVVAGCRRGRQTWYGDENKRLWWLEGAWQDWLCGKSKWNWYIWWKWYLFCYLKNHGLVIVNVINPKESSYQNNALSCWRLS